MSGVTATQHEAYRSEIESLTRILGDQRTLIDDLRARLAAAEAVKPVCKWRPDEPYYETGCGHAWQFIDGTIADNDVSFCPYCGCKIELPKCHICGDTECDLDHCVDCGKAFCSECGGFCCNPDDPQDGDYFCDRCIEGD